MSAGRLATVALLLVSACATPRDAEPPVAAPVGTPDAQLRRALASEVVRPEAYAVMDSLSLELGVPRFARLLGDVAMDTTASALVRTNALLELAARLAVTELRAFRAALRAGDHRVRAAAAIGLGRLIPRAGADVIVPLLETALADPDELVQLKALEALSDHDADALRRYLAADPPAELRAVATELLQVAEQRGAPLEGAGELTRVGFSGARITYRPLRRWDQWDASVGELWVTAPGGEPVLVADGVEVVANVVPAFFSPDGRFVVYEADRTIRVRDLNTGADHEIGEGIAPRPLPFTNEFIYFRPRADRWTAGRDRTDIDYIALRVPFLGGPAREVEEVGGVASQERHGNYSPLRWARIRENQGRFILVAEGLQSLRLPDPFTEAGSE